MLPRLYLSSHFSGIDVTPEKNSTSGPLMYLLRSWAIDEVSYPKLFHPMNQDPLFYFQFDIWFRVKHSSQQGTMKAESGCIMLWCLFTYHWSVRLKRLVIYKSYVCWHQTDLQPCTDSNYPNSY